ncbi:MAG TPA: hypothetical protein VFZ75_05825, partial [Actinomycetota bacterium]|nr:hypothetical protein [Actinomycetota bacterium]
GSGKSLAARAFAAALLCHRGACGSCRDCRLAEEDHHPNQFVIEPERGLLRSTEAPDRMEMEGQEFHTKVADGYLKIAEEHPERIVVVDADRAPGAVFERVRAALDKALGEREDDAAAGRLRPVAGSSPTEVTGEEDAGSAASSHD